jgi:glycosyltransferase involved in cell wall biosynthesis
MSDISVYHEVGGDAVGYFDPNDLDSIASIMVRATTDPEWLRELAAKGAEHHKRFTWERTARETVAAYNDALAYGSRPRR